MNTITKIGVTSIATLLIVFIVITLSVDNDNFSIQQFDSIKQQTNRIDKYSVAKSNFSQNYFLEYFDWSDPSIVNQSFNKVLSITKDTAVARDVFIEIYTTNLREKYTIASLDSLNIMLNWADKLETISYSHPEVGYAYSIVKDDWYQYTSRTLEKTQKIGVHSFKFRYLMSKCNENSYSPDIRVSNLEKVVLYVAEGRWSYLIKRFLYSASFKLQLFSIILAITTLISYISLFKQVKLKTKEIKLN